MMPDRLGERPIGSYGASDNGRKPEDRCRGGRRKLFYAAAIFPRDAVTIEGETRDHEGRHFCPRCGSSVFARSGDETEVYLGSLDAPDQLMPTYESWICRREAWLPPFPLAHRYERDREGAGRFEV